MSTCLKSAPTTLGEQSTSLEEGSCPVSMRKRSVDRVTDTDRDAAGAHPANTGLQTFPGRSSSSSEVIWTDGAVGIHESRRVKGRSKGQELLSASMWSLRTFGAVAHCAGYHADSEHSLDEQTDG